MSEAIASIKAAREQLRAEAAGSAQAAATTYPDGVVAAAISEAGSAADPGLFDRTFYVHSVATGSSDMTAFGGPFSDVYDQSASELDNSDFSPLKAVLEDVLEPEYVFQGRTRVRMASGPYPIEKTLNESLVER